MTPLRTCRKQFYVMGYSAGTPYAAAAATVIPHERVLGISVVAGISNAPDATRKYVRTLAYSCGIDPLT